MGGGLPVRTLLVLLVGALSACADGPADTGGTCAETAPVNYFQSGDYVSQAGTPTDDTCESGCSAVFTPHDSVENFAMSLDLSGQVATISFTRDGVEVVERWRFSSRESR